MPCLRRLWPIRTRTVDVRTGPIRTPDVIAKPRPASLFPYTTLTPLSMTNQNSRCHFKATPNLSLPVRRVKSTSEAHELCRHRGGIRSTESPPANTDQTDWRYLAFVVTLIRGRRPYFPWTIGDYTIYCATPATTDQTEGLGPIQYDFK